jgi:DNA-binding MarR family transcriptional regulator
METVVVPPQRNPNVLLQSFIVGQLASELLRRELEPTGMTPNEFGVQSVIGALGPLTPSELANRLGMAAPTVSAWIKRLEAKGQIRKLPHPNDRRSYLIESTEAGRSAVQAAMPRFVTALLAVEAELGEELDVVWRGGEAFQQALRAILANGSELK